jgi:hypothetical protein
MRSYLESFDLSAAFDNFLAACDLFNRRSEQPFSFAAISLVI